MVKSFKLVENGIFQEEGVCYECFVLRVYNKLLYKKFCMKV